MRVLLSLRSDADRVVGGDVEAARQLAAALPRHGVSVDVTTGEPSLDGVDLLHLINVVNLTEVARRLAAARAAGVAVVITPEYTNLDRFFLRTHWKAALARRLLGESTALTLFRLKRRLSQEWKLLRWVLGSADRVVAKSNREARELCADFALPPSKVIVVKNGIDPSFGRRSRPQRFVARYLAGQVKAGEFLLTVGRVEPIKNQLSLLAATRDLSYPLVLIGGGLANTDAYLTLCRQAARGRPVFFLDRLPREELPHAYAAARGHVAPSFAETTSLVSLEAVLAGCPIAVTRESPYEEYLGPETVTLDPYDVDSIRQAVLRLIKHPPPTAPVAARLRHELAWSTIAREHCRVYEQVLGRPVAPGQTKG